MKRSQQVVLTLLASTAAVISVRGCVGCNRHHAYPPGVSTGQPFPQDEGERDRPYPIHNGVYIPPSSGFRGAVPGTPAPGGAAGLAPSAPSGSSASSSAHTGGSVSRGGFGGSSSGRASS